MKRGFDRKERIADLIQKALAKIILEDKNHSQFGFVTITSVTLSRDLSSAKIYVSVLVDEEDKIKQTIQSLNDSQKSIRYQLAHEVKLRIVPELRFIYDESTAKGFRISTLINTAVKRSEKDKK